MPLAYVLDEHLRNLLWQAIQQHNAAEIHVIDVTQVGHPVDLPLGSKDPEILLWAEREGRIVITCDRRTMPGHLTAHLQAGRHSPGLFMLRSQATGAQIIDYLVLTAYAGDPALYPALRNAVFLAPGGACRGACLPAYPGRTARRRRRWRCEARTVRYVHGMRRW